MSRHQFAQSPGGVRWLVLAFGISLVACMILQSRARRERRESNVWKGFRGDAPMDLTGYEQFDPKNYTSAGQTPFRWFLAAWVTTLGLGLALLYALNR
jgi:hypothetical protein